jgi:hypothetical protein
MLEIIGKIAEQGTIGLVAALALLFAIMKDQQATKVLNENRELTKQLIDGYRSLAQDIAKLVDLNPEERQDEQANKQLDRGGDRDNRGPRPNEATNSPATNEDPKKTT